MPIFRPDFADIQRRTADKRSPDRLVAHYVLERELSDKLRNASRPERSSVYTSVYEQLFASLPDHPQRITRSFARTDDQLNRISHLIKPKSVFLEIGCGDGRLSFALAEKLGKSYALDVTDALLDQTKAPPNWEFLKTSGTEIPLGTCTIDFAYSNQLMEHLHPEDAEYQLTEIYRVLKPGGSYYCTTPSRVTGPHDVSRYFDYEAKCFHLMEYDYSSLRTLFKKIGFRNFNCIVYVRGKQIKLPYIILRGIEMAFSALPVHVRARLVTPRLIQAVLGITVVGVK